MGHIQAQPRANLVVVAPRHRRSCMAKMAGGLANDSWPRPCSGQLTRRLLIVLPAMNVRMWASTPRPAASFDPARRLVFFR